MYPYIYVGPFIGNASSPSAVTVSGIQVLCVWTVKVRYIIISIFSILLNIFLYLFLFVLIIFNITLQGSLKFSLNYCKSAVQRFSRKYPLEFCELILTR